MLLLIEQIKEKMDDYKEVIEKKQKEIKELKEAFTNYVPDCVKKSIELNELEISRMSNYIIKFEKVLKILEE